MPPTPPLDREIALLRTARSLKVLGLASGGWGAFFIVTWGYFNRSERFRPYFIVLGLIVWLVPGVLMCLFAWTMETQRRRSSAIWAILTAIGQGLFAIAGLIGSVILPPISPIPILLCAMWIAAIAQLIVYLKLSLPLLDIDVERRHGFEVRAFARYLKNRRSCHC